MVVFINEHHLLYESQYVFQINHSTVDAITEFVTKLLPSLDKREICLSAYRDLSKAFDTINHDVMMKWLHYYDIRGNALAWFNSYISQRRQYVCYKGVSSEVQWVDYSSAVGHLLCIIYTNDIPHSISHGTTIMFADDNSSCERNWYAISIWSHECCPKVTGVRPTNYQQIRQKQRTFTLVVAILLCLNICGWAWMVNYCNMFHLPSFLVCSLMNNWSIYHISYLALPQNVITGNVCIKYV